MQYVGHGSFQMEAAYNTGRKHFIYLTFDEEVFVELEKY